MNAPRMIRAAFQEAARFRMRAAGAGRAGGRSLLAVLLGAAAAGAGCNSTSGPAPPPPPPAPPPGFALATEVVVSGLESPLFLTSPPGDPRLFILEKVGRIRVVSAGGELLATPFLNLVGQVDGEPEGGLLGLAFHPQYAQNGFAYVNYTNTSGNTVVARYTVSGDPNRLSSGSAKQILGLTQRRSNHNGGMLQFGPDGMLYIFLGDEGGVGDPFGNGQNLGTLHGSALRIDVDGGDPYAIPPDNPFVGVQGAREEIWAYGLRNPWRSTFDPPGGTLYLADVGQSDREEINAIPATLGGVNFGWNTMEGSTCYGGGGCDTSGLTLPVEEYTHAEGCSVTGGYVYRGAAIPEITGLYFYSDFCSGFLRSFRLVDGTAVERTEWDVGELGSVTSFGVDAAGELYILAIDGRVSRLVAGG